MEADAQLTVAQRFRIARARSRRLLAKADAHTDWMNECVPELMDSGKEQDVAVAACLNIWRDAWEESHPDGAVDPGPPRPEDKAIRARARGMLKEWDESKHPRVPAGSPDGGQFGGGGGGAAEDSTPSKKPGKSKKPAKKEDFDKAKIRFRAGEGGEQAFLDKWNEKIGIEPEEFKQTFLGGVPATMDIYIEGGEFKVNGNLQDANGQRIGDYSRFIDPDKKSAYSSFFELNRSKTGGDVGKKVLAGNVETYQQLGIEKVKVSANIDVGGYAWAKYGYVPTQDSWDTLRASLARTLTGSSSSAIPASDNTYEADSWDMLSSDVQDDVRDRWMRDSRDEFISSEEQNWRESGQAKDDAKRELADEFTNYQVSTGDVPEWVNEALDGARKYFEDRGEPPIPYTNRQLYDAVELTFDSRNGDGEDDPDIGFDDNMLKEPQGYDPAQGTLPGIEEEDPSQRLTQAMRDRIEKRIIKAFDEKAESNAQDMDAPSYLADNVSEYQDEYWDQKSDREKLQHAIDYDMANIEIEPDEEDEEPQAEMDLPPKAEADPLLDAVHSSDPKSIWKIADSAQGKRLLLGTSWSGVLNLKDKATLDRFNKYVGKAA